jgi:hypothetical protein
MYPARGVLLLLQRLSITELNDDSDRYSDLFAAWNKFSLNDDSDRFWILPDKFFQYSIR